MGKNSKTFQINMDNRLLEAHRGLTILQAAENNGIYIPTLCAHKELTPFGGCRMCIVEVEGMRGLPTACTTPVEEGMVIRTRTSQVQAERKEILQLILSEHTSSCLICDEKVECKEFMGTIRKAGVTTGCRYCPNDDQCELQDVVEYLELDEIGYPVYYRGLPVEKEDPFYDRDYNLCILCGRCIRVCQEIRTANTLAFKKRGHYTVIGPAFDRTHMEAGCEFCGACVSVCPTGALAEKARKWEGKPDREQITICALCGVGCQMRLLIKGEKVIGSLPAEGPVVNSGQLCVKGRFCVAELTNHHRRLRNPQQHRNGAKVEITWDEAIQAATAKLSACSPQQFGMLISPNCSNEDLYIAQKFVRAALGSANIDCSARTFYGHGFNAYLDLLRQSVPLADMEKSSAILCVGLDARFGRSVVGVALRKAMKCGTRIVTINPRPHNLALMADNWLQPILGTEVDLLRSLVKMTQQEGETSRPGAKKKGTGLDKELYAVAQMLRDAPAPLILIGSEFLQHNKSWQIFELVWRLAQNVGAGILPLPAQNNLLGSILMGTYPELLPGGFSSADQKRTREFKKSWSADLTKFSTRWNANALSTGRRLKVLYLIGEVLPDSHQLADFTIYQNIYPTDALGADALVLPSAAFTEAEGTFINGEGRIQRVRKAVRPPGEALPDWEILCRMARKMGKKGFDFSSARQIHREISRSIPGLGSFHRPKRKAITFAWQGKMKIPRPKVSGKVKAGKRVPFILHASSVEHAYRGFPLTALVEGARKIFPQDMVDINPKDAQKKGLSQGDAVAVSCDRFQETWIANIVDEQPPGTLHVTLHQSPSLGANPHRVEVKKKDV
jgi:formate dehydrogenase alpha subunit